MNLSFTMAQKVGRMFLTGFLGSEMTAEMAELIDKYHVGHFVFFDQRNIQTLPQFLKLTRDVQARCLAANGAPAFIAVDNEGGLNSQLLSVGTVFPGNMALAATGDPRQVGIEGRAIAREIKAAGLSANFAPVLDLYDGTNPGIGARCFGEDPKKVSSYALAYMRAHQKEGVVNVGKHFPGLSKTDTDPHHGLSRIRRTSKELWTMDMVPYRALIKAGLPAVMTAHALYPAWDKKMPATLSHKILTGVLRKKMGFKGVIMTDDIEMKAIEDEFGIEGAVELVVRAGGDMVMVCHTFEKMKSAIEHLARLAERDPEIARRVEESFERILKMDSLAAPYRPRPKGVLRSSSHLRLADKQAQASVTLVRDEKKLVPLKLKKGQKLGVINPLHTMYGWNQPVKLDLAFAKVLGSKKVRSVLFDPRTAKTSEAKVLKLARSCDALVAGTYDGQFSPPQVQMIGKLAKLGKPLVVVATRSPQDWIRFPQVGTYVVCYNFYQVSLNAAAQAICGRVPFKGRMPVCLLKPSKVYTAKAKYKWAKV
jgi:beta-N-acetylhexosaminidase